MPKQTQKYRTACELAERLSIEERDNSERLYRLLNEARYYWDTGSQTWLENTIDADPPTELVRVRVWAEDSKVRGAAYQVRIAMEEQGYIFLQQSEPYPCRPPKQLESRIYLDFK